VPPQSKDDAQEHVRTLRWQKREVEQEDVNTHSHAEKEELFKSDWDGNEVQHVFCCSGCAAPPQALQSQVSK
jgi:hypothetical protein